MFLLWPIRETLFCAEQGAVAQDTTSLIRNYDTLIYAVRDTYVFHYYYSLVEWAVRDAILNMFLLSATETGIL